MSLTFELNDQQRELVDLTKNWHLHGTKQTWEVSGPAGSGKTSVVYETVRELGIDPDCVMYMAYVGKAAMALAMKGNNAKTIHGSIYDLTPIPILDDKGEPVTKNGRMVTRMGFTLKPFLDPKIRLIVVDEGSMVNKKIREDILSFGLPVLVLGDLNQLPPVFGDPAFLLKPDYILTKIERQKEDDPIVKLSQMAIRGEEIQHGKYGPMCFVIPKNIPEEKLQNLMKSSDIIICGKNLTRQNINNYYRSKILGIENHNVPIVGDKIICRRNNWKLSIGSGIHLINGLIGYIDNMYLDTYNKRSMHIDFRPEFMTEQFERIDMDYPYLFKDLTDKETDNRFAYYNQFQFAYAISAHLSQGSQYNKVLVYDEHMGNRNYYSKWLYTSITRAVSGLVLMK